MTTTTLSLRLFYIKHVLYIVVTCLRFYISTTINCRNYIIYGIACLQKKPLWGPVNMGDSIELRGSGDRVATWMYYVSITNFTPITMDAHDLNKDYKKSLKIPKG